jgi:hypothetical protein
LTLALAAGIALAVSPAHASLAAPAARTLDVRNNGTQTLVINVRPSATWLLARPRRLRLRGGARAAVTVRAHATNKTPAGDHELLVLLVAHSEQTGRVAVRMRLGVRLRVRVPGRLVRRLVPRGVRLSGRGKARALLVAVANMGNVTEQLQGHVTVTLVRGRHRLSRLRYRTRRELFPGTAGVVRLAYRGGVRGPVTASVTTGAVTRRYRLRL